jgi:hypothetical protein
LARRINRRRSSKKLIELVALRRSFGLLQTQQFLGSADAEQQHALSLAVIGLAMPHGSKRTEVDVLLALPQPIGHKRRLLSAAAKAGEIVPAGLLMTGLTDLLEAAKTQPWRLNENYGELMGWIELFPFSDDPLKIHEALSLLPEQHRRPHALRRLLQILPQSPAGSALVMLERLAAENPSYLQEFDWRNALLKLDTEAAAQVALDKLCAGAISVHDGLNLSAALTAWAQKYPKVRSAIIARYRTSPVGPVQGALERALDDMIDEEIFTAMFDRHVGERHAIRNMASSIRNLTVGRKPSDGNPGWFEEFGVPLTGLRARLFGMLTADDERARLAKQCLIAIDQCRDDHGPVSSEPRHPDITTGRPWPPEAGELPSSQEA